MYRGFDTGIYSFKFSRGWKSFPSSADYEEHRRSYSLDNQSAERDDNIFFRLIILWANLIVRFRYIENGCIFLIENVKIFIRVNISRWPLSTSLDPTYQRPYRTPHVPTVHYIHRYSVSFYSRYCVRSCVPSFIPPWMQPAPNSYTHQSNIDYLYLLSRATTRHTSSSLNKGV